MCIRDSPLLKDSSGIRPNVAFEHVIQDGIAAISYAAEARSLLVATIKGQLFHISHRGDLKKRVLGFKGLQHLNLCDTGEFGIASIDGGQVVCFNRKLQKLWEVELTGDVVGQAITPFGSHIAVCTESSQIHIVTIDQKQVSHFDVTRPLPFLTFLHNEPHLVGSAEFGHLCCHDLKGKEQWSERIANNVGGMVVTGCGTRILLAAFTHGVQAMNGSGKHQGSFMIDGVAARIAGSSTRKRFGLVTDDNRLMWLDYEGNVKWTCNMQRDPVTFMQVGPMGDRMFIATASGRLLHLIW